ncbi:hypothetical protein COE25_03000 [Bacillus sp. AFS031507]|nr:hypothetical protein COE25_03000 [Bacillus sp. AFS031507]
MKSSLKWSTIINLLEGIYGDFLRNMSDGEIFLKSVEIYSYITSSLWAAFCKIKLDSKSKGCGL